MFYRHSFCSLVTRGRSALVGSGLIVLVSFWLARSATGQDWRTGQSNWNGSSYETLPPPAPDSAPQPTTPQRAPLELSEEADQWSREFGLSDAALVAPVIDPGGVERASSDTQLPLTDGPGMSSAVGSGMESFPMGSAIAEGQSFDAPPLQEEVVRWYQIPWQWITEGWDNHAEFGLDGSSGNADTLAIQTGLEMKRKTDRYTLALDIDYRQASASNQTTEDNGRLNLDYDRMFRDSPWSAFGKFGMEFDEFKAFDLRLNLNGGLGYYWIRNDTTNFVSRFGAGASKEIGSPDDDWIPEAVFGLEADHQISSRQKIKAKVDYFPAWNDFANYRIVTDVAWETLLDSSDNLSLRLSITDRYDSTPQGAEPNDFYYSALLLYKF